MRLCVHDARVPERHWQKVLFRAHFKRVAEESHRGRALALMLREFQSKIPVGCAFVPLLCEFQRKITTMRLRVQAARVPEDDHRGVRFCAHAVRAPVKRRYGVRLCNPVVVRLPEEGLGAAPSNS